MKIAVIGVGSVGGTLARRWAAAGHDIVVGARDPGSKSVHAFMQSVPAGTSVSVSSIAEAAAAADVLVLATPWEGAEAAIREAGDLTGKIVVDCTNPLTPTLALSLGYTDSGAEAIARAATGARVVKAFNTTGFANMEQPIYDGVRTAMFVCGDDADARKTVAGLAEDLGFEGVECGPLANARLLEPVAALWIWLAYPGGLGRDFAFALVRR